MFSTLSGELRVTLDQSRAGQLIMDFPAAPPVEILPSEFSELTSRLVDALGLDASSIPTWIGRATGEFI